MLMILKYGKIIAIGDSHVRSFANNEYFIPFYLGAGRDNCFINDEKTIITKNRLFEIMSKFNVDDVFMLVLGEPDCRWCTYNNWQPGKIQYDKIDKSINRF